jgi:hypothetical protein
MLLGFMAMQSSKPPTARINSWGADSFQPKVRWLKASQMRGLRRQLTDLDAKLRQMTAAERDRYR